MSPRCGRAAAPRHCGATAAGGASWDDGSTRRPRPLPSSLPRRTWCLSRTRAPALGKALWGQQARDTDAGVDWRRLEGTLAGKEWFVPTSWNDHQLQRQGQGPGTEEGPGWAQRQCGIGRRALGSDSSASGHCSALLVTRSVTSAQEANSPSGPGLTPAKHPHPTCSRLLSWPRLSRRAVPGELNWQREGRGGPPAPQPESLHIVKGGGAGLPPSTEEAQRPPCWQGPETALWVPGASRDGSQLAPWGGTGLPLAPGSPTPARLFALATALPEASSRTGGVFPLHLTSPVRRAWPGPAPALDLSRGTSILCPGGPDA